MTEEVQSDDAVLGMPEEHQVKAINLYTEASFGICLVFVVD